VDFETEKKQQSSKSEHAEAKQSTAEITTVNQPKMRLKKHRSSL
jgi:hypothetical protein